MLLCSRWWPRGGSVEKLAAPRPFVLRSFPLPALARGKTGSGPHRGWRHRYHVDVSYERGPRGPAAFRRVERRGESAMRKPLIWVATLLAVDLKDLVGRGNCTPRRRGKTVV
jgi:hypothetical protein